MSNIYTTPPNFYTSVPFTDRTQLYGVDSGAAYEPILNGNQDYTLIMQALKSYIENECQWSRAPPGFDKALEASCANPSEAHQLLFRRPFELWFAWYQAENNNQRARLSKLTPASTTTMLDQLDNITPHASLKDLLQHLFWDSDRAAKRRNWLQSVGGRVPKNENTGTSRHLQRKAARSNRVPPASNVFTPENITHSALTGKHIGHQGTALAALRRIYPEIDASALVFPDPDALEDMFRIQILRLHPGTRCRDYLAWMHQGHLTPDWVLQVLIDCHAAEHLHDILITGHSNPRDLPRYYNSTIVQVDGELLLRRLFIGTLDLSFSDDLLEAWEASDARKTELESRDKRIDYDDYTWNILTYVGADDGHNPRNFRLVIPLAASYAPKIGKKLWPNVPWPDKKSQGLRVAFDQ